MAEYICPHCKKPVYDDDALLCLYCGESLNRGLGFMGKLRYPKLKTVIVFLIVLVLLAFLALIIKNA